MPEEFKILDFSANFSNNIKALDFLPIQNLHSHFMLCKLMFANCGSKHKR